MTRSRSLAFLLLLISLAPAMPAAARTYIEEGEKVDTEEREHYHFTIDENSSPELKLTVFFKAGHRGHLRIYFYEPSVNGGWSEMDSMRMIIKKNFKQKSTTFGLPDGKYRVSISVRRGEYGFKLEDAPEDEEDE